MTYTLTIDRTITTCRDCPCLQGLRVQTETLSWYCGANCRRVDRDGRPQACPMREVDR